MPEVAIASKTPCHPDGMNCWLVKLALLNWVARNATMTSRMTAIFQPTSALLIRANQRIP